MQPILRLDIAGQPRGWISLHEAVTAYAKGDVVYGIGDVLPPVWGGIQRHSGLRSRIDLQPIVAIQGRIIQGFTPPLCNRTLFRRDDHRCLYCGGQFNRSELHSFPTSTAANINIGSVAEPKQITCPAKYLKALPFVPNVKRYS